MMDRSRDSKGKALRAGLSALVLLIVIFFSSPVAPYLRGMFVSLFARHSGDAGAAQYASLSHDALVSRLTDAENELSTIKYQSVLYGLLADENAKLREALHANPAPHATLARVLSRPPRTAYDTLLIDQGTNSLIQVGDIATYQNSALGKVISVGAGSALVQLFSSSGTDEDVLVGKPATISIAHGLGGGAFEVSVPQGVTVAAGDFVKLSGAEPLLLGVVAGVSSKPDDPSQLVRFRSPVSFADLDFVEVIAGTSHTP